MHGVLTVMAAGRTGVAKITPNHTRGKLGQFKLDRCGLQTSQRPQREVLGLQGLTSMTPFNLVSVTEKYWKRQRQASTWLITSRRSNVMMQADLALKIG
jgi:hypothetical protein